MAFPSIAATSTTLRSVAETTSPVNLPTGIVSGNLLLVFVRAAAAGAVGWPAGWTELFEDASDASDDVTALAWRKADGTEGATIDVTHGSAKLAALSWRITGAEDPAIQAPQFSTVATGTSTAPDSSSLSPTGGAKDYLWLALAAYEGEQSLTPTYPTNYSSNQLTVGTGTGGAIATNCRVSGSNRTNNAASEDPGAYTISVSDDWSAWTVAIHPFSGYVLTAANGSFSLTGQAANTLKGYRAPADSGSFSLSGQDAVLRHGYSLVAGQGAFTLTGNAAGLQATRQLAASFGSFALSGQAAVLARQITLIAASGAFGLTGEAAGALAARQIAAALGTFAFTGQPATLLKAWRLSAALGSYALTGQAAGLIYSGGGAGPVLVASAGLFTLSGQAASLLLYTAADLSWLASVSAIVDAMGNVAAPIPVSQSPVAGGVLSFSVEVDTDAVPG